MRSWLTGISIALSITVAGCGAAPGEEETTPVASSALRPLEIARPEAQLRAIEGEQAVFDIRVIVTNPNEADVVLRRATGELMLDGNRVARLEIDGEEPLEADSERVFVFDVSVPVSMLATVRADQYVARGTLYADGGTGDGALQTPFELTGDVPSLTAP
ncbi:LEA type 2 family protein [Sandaracinus amylolyticus]|uniref:NDR1/HIN1-like protein n=1 Tax=Sandaracinus amylolyticus TaxID=927083 RepID=UPI001F1A7A3A|nr:LEA type 2 family protein [Sandaracinus amylolyticus]UJR78796.1 Hypothetical protein I5071_8290 [Sandaracinus amylolyticus]